MDEKERAMLTQIENKYGKVIFRRQLAEQIISDALALREGRIWLARSPGPEIGISEKGVNMRIYAVMRFGSSISANCGAVLRYVAGQIENSLELPVGDLTIVVTAMMSRRPVKRHIEVSYSSICREFEK
jgi:hypothetical protein